MANTINSNAPAVDEVPPHNREAVLDDDISFDWQAVMTGNATAEQWTRVIREAMEGDADLILSGNLEHRRAAFFTIENDDDKAAKERREREEEATNQLAVMLQEMQKKAQSLDTAHLAHAIVVEVQKQLQERQKEAETGKGGSKEDKPGEMEGVMLQILDELLKAICSQEHREQVKETAKAELLGSAG